MKLPRTWVIVADGASARMFSADPAGKRLELMPGGELKQESLRSAEIASSRPGRVYESVGRQRHSVGFSSDPHDLQEKAFLEGLVDRLDREDGFDRLIIVAPARALGVIRKALPPELRKRVGAEFAHDYVHQSVDQILDLVRADLPVPANWPADQPE